MNAIFFMILVLGIWSFCAPEKSPVSKRIGISLLSLNFVIAVVCNFHTFARDPFAQQFGTLKPKKNIVGSSRMSNSHLFLNQANGFWKIRVNSGEIVQPLGPYVPFSIKKENDGLLISLIIYDWDGKIAAELINNKWKREPAKSWKFNFDKSGLEIIDHYRVPIFQIDYIDTETIKIGGVFRSGKVVISEEYPDFPCDLKNQKAICILGEGKSLLMGNGWMDHVAYPNESEFQEVLAYARNLIKPWFDYSEPDKLGKRLSNINEEEYELSYAEKNKYANYSNAQLKNRVEEFVKSLQEFSVNCGKTLKSNDINIDEMTNKSKEEQRKSIKDHMNKETILHEKFLNDYKINFQKEAIILRDTLLQRLPQEPLYYFEWYMYDDPVNTSAFSHIRNDLLRLVNQLVDNSSSQK